jgi:hypothetical protein
MKTPAELIADLGHTIGEMENDSLAAFEYAGLLSVLTASPDAECAMDGIHRLMLEIRDRANNLRMKQDEAWQIYKRLANP